MSASTLRDLGDPATARVMLEQSLTEARESGWRSWVAQALAALGEVALDQGDPDRAESLLKEALAMEQHMGEGRVITRLLECCAGLAVALDMPERALRLGGAATARRDTMHTPAPPAQRTRLDCWLASARRGLGQDAAAEALAEGQGMTLDEAVEYALGDGAD